MSAILGFDLSLNHGAVVELRKGRLTWMSYYTTLAGSAKKHLNGWHLKLPKSEDRQELEIVRLAQVEAWLRSVFLARRPEYVGIESYALHQANRAHQIGEVGGAARLLCWRYGVKFRLHDPTSVKMFVTHDGTAQKDLMELFVKRRWKADFSSYNQPPNKRTRQENRCTSEDLADAFGVAQLVWCEVRLRSGELALKALEHDKERQVFMRTTKPFPVSLLGREWLCNPEGRFADLQLLISKLELKKPKVARALIRLAG